jgi:hypothetical protein
MDGDERGADVGNACPCGKLNGTSLALSTLPRCAYRANSFLVT